MASNLMSLSLLLLLHLHVCLPEEEKVACMDGVCERAVEDEEEGSLSLCPYPPPNLGDFEVDLTLLPPATIVKRCPEVLPGGSWRPTGCQARQSVAIIVPYRERLHDLMTFLPNLHHFLKHQLLDYTIFLVEQLDTKHFNRAALLNIGFIEAHKLQHYDCIILHDVDKFPEDTRNLYMCSDQPTHLISKQRYVNKQYRERPYEDYFGGVTAISSVQFRKVNGFSNIFWGWGSEDDDFLERLKFHDLHTRRVPEDVGRYREIWHPYGFVNPRRHEVKKEGKKRFHTDGLNSLDYKLVYVKLEQLYTHIGVELLHADPYTTS